MLTPMLLLAGVAITSAAQVQLILEWMFQVEFVGRAATQILTLSPIFINAAGIGVLYAVMPHRRPVWRPIMISALITGMAWQLVQLSYVNLQVGVARNDAIYGALAQLPVTLLWLYVSWVIILAGAEIAALLEFGSAAWRTARTEPDPQALALELLLEAGENFAHGRIGVEPRAVVRRLGIRIDAMHPVTAVLQELGWLVAIEGQPDTLTLARDPETMELRALAELERGDWVPPHVDARVKAVLVEVTWKRPEQWGDRTLADLLGSAAPARPREVPERRRAP
jgi:membrane protein